MKFSIIIACYNLGELVRQAIESCIHQKDIDVSDYEIIVINDGSKDNTLLYIQEYNNISNLRIIDKPNGGLSQTRNVGLQESHGEYVLFLDGDDWYTEDALHTLSKYCDSYDVVAFPMFYYYSDNKYSTNLFGLEQGEYTKERFLHLTLGRKQFCIIPAQKKAYKRSFLLDNNIKFLEGILHEDNPFFLDVMDKCNSLFFIDKALYYYRQNRDGSITSQCTLNNFDGVIKGIDHARSLHIFENRDVRFLNGNMLAFQVAGNYSRSSDAEFVYRYLRQISVKCDILKYLLTSTFDIKHFIRLLALLVDPLLLKFIIRIS